MRVIRVIRVIGGMRVVRGKILVRFSRFVYANMPRHVHTARQGITAIMKSLDKKVEIIG